MTDPLSIGPENVFERERYRQTDRNRKARYASKSMEGMQPEGKERVNGSKLEKTEQQKEIERACGASCFHCPS